MSRAIYLDYAAATPLNSEVLAAMQPFFSEEFYNPSATYLAAKRAGEQLQGARSKVAHWLGCRPAEVIFTAGGTEANNLAIHGIMEQFPEGNIAVSGIEHESVLAPAHRYDCREIAVRADGIIDLQALADAINDQTVLVSIMYANNEIGTIQPLRDIAKVIADKKAARKSNLPLYLHTDACQAGNYLDLHVSRLGVDLMTLNGGKIYGPKQSGALFVSSKVTLQPQVFGGGQERGLRSGTENVAQDVGLAIALDQAQSMRQTETARLQELQREFMKLLGDNFPEVIINGSRTKRLPNNVHVTFPGQDNERLLMQLDEAGIMAAAGSACSASNEEPSHVLRALGIRDADAQASLRFTMGRHTRLEDIQTLVKTLARLMPKISEI